MKIAKILLTIYKGIRDENNPNISPVRDYLI